MSLPGRPARPGSGPVELNRRHRKSAHESSQVTDLVSFGLTEEERERESRESERSGIKKVQASGRALIILDHDHYYYHPHHMILISLSFLPAFYVLMCIEEENYNKL